MILNSFDLLSSLHQHVFCLERKMRIIMLLNIYFFMFSLQSKSFILYLNWNQRENLNRGVERYCFKVKLWYCCFLTNVDDNNIIILSSMINLWLFASEWSIFSEKRERQRIVSEKKEKFSAAIKKDRLRWVFPCGKKQPLSLRLKKSFRCCKSKKDGFGTILPL